MKSPSADFARAYLGQARHALLRHHLPRIARCLSLLSDRQIWWHSHPTSNSVGNLVLHLAGNVRQWIISGLGGSPDVRRRDEEFSARGPIPRRLLLSMLRDTATEASRILGRLRPRDLARTYSIQGFRVTGLEAVHDVTTHFVYHAGQIIFLTKLKLRKDLAFTRLPGEKLSRTRSKRLPALQVSPRGK